MKKKTVALLLALVLVFGVAAGGTLAWLTDKTGEVKNTFTYGDINIELTETWNTDSDGDNKNDCWTAYMAPGYSYDKDPKVTVKADSVDCYLFVKFEKSNDSLLTYVSNLTGANGWTQGTGEGGDGVPNNVWYRIVSKSADDQEWELIDGNTVSVDSSVTKEQVKALNNKTATLTYTAYACQLKSNNTDFTPADAWAKVNP